MDTLPLVPRFAVEPKLVELAHKLPPEGAIVITDRTERVAAISSNLVSAVGSLAVATSVILVAPTSEAERAEVERLTAAGQLRPIFHDPAMPAYRQSKLVPLPETLEALIEAQAADRQRRVKLERNHIRASRRCAHHADLIAAIKALPNGSCVLLVQSPAYGHHVRAMIPRLRPDLISPRIGIFIVLCPSAQSEEAVLADLPDFTSHLPVIRTPGLAIARGRAVEREAKAAQAAEVEQVADPICTTAPPAGRTVEERVATCERILGELMTWFAGSMERSPLVTPAAIARADWLCGLMNELLDSVQASR